jgi:hypothetical protein
MSTPSDGYKVGYGHPPLETRWKKGQSGYSRKAKAKPQPTETTLAVIDQLLVGPVQIVMNGETKKMSALEAILFQLLQKSLSGDKKAQRALREYEEFANRNQAAQFEIVFVDNEYTKALSARREGDNG